MTAPELSVVMPVFNGIPFLPAAVESILMQRDVSLELIVVNDGSVDGSADWLARRAPQDRRLRILHQNQQGIYAAMRAGVEASSARFFAVMDADDIALPTRLAAQLSEMRRDVECAALGTWAILIDEKGLSLGTLKPPTRHEEIRRAAFRGEWGVIIHPTAMIRREAYERVGGYRAEFRNSGDVDLWFRLMEVGRLRNLPEVLLGYRQHTRSASYLSTRKQEDFAKKAIAEACERASLPAPQSTGFSKPNRQAPWACAWDCARIAHESRRRMACVRLCVRLLLRPSSWPRGAALALSLLVAEIVPGKLRAALCRRLRRFPFYLDPRLAAHTRRLGGHDWFFIEFSKKR